MTVFSTDKHSRNLLYFQLKNESENDCIFSWKIKEKSTVFPAEKSTVFSVIYSRFLMDFSTENKVDFYLIFWLKIQSILTWFLSLKYSQFLNWKYSWFWLDFSAESTVDFQLKILSFFQLKLQSISTWFLSWKYSQYQIDFQLEI